ncbi:MAG: glutamine-hydrolyzing GMP synthase, partial [Planctomycetota bacterium]
MKSVPRGILIVDLGAQYAQLIARRVREAGSYCEIAPPRRALEAAAGMDLGGVILSGGPASVYASDAPVVPQEILELGVPVLGICYGMQWMCQALGGEVLHADKREFGRASIAVVHSAELFEGIGGHTVVWMSHGDSVSRLPAGWEVYAQTENCPFAAAGDRARGMFGLQFHPEVTHTLRGAELIENFVTNVCRMPGDWKPENIVEREVR